MNCNECQGVINLPLNKYNTDSTKKLCFTPSLYYAFVNNKTSHIFGRIRRALEFYILIIKHFKTMKKWRVFTTMIALFFAMACVKPLISDELNQDNIAALNSDPHVQKGEK
jgi:hypothetical protein